jgi:chemotaxis protein MotB
VIPGGEMKLDPSTPAAVRREPKTPESAAEARAALERAAGRLKAVLASMPEVQKLRDQIEIQVAADGMRIELVEKSEATFFDSGSATLKPETERILAAMAGELAKLSHPLVVEGHTDSRPFYGASGYSNWELSADRANAARRALERNGLPATQVLAVRGFSDRQLRVRELPTDPRNRRVSIVVPSEVAGTAFVSPADAAPAGTGGVAAPVRAPSEPGAAGRGH